MRKNNKLREIRLAQGLSGYDLQLLSNINVQRIYLFERGIARPNSSERKRISAALQIPEEKVFPPKMRFTSRIEKI